MSASRGGSEMGIRDRTTRVSAGKVNSVRYKGRCFEVVCTSPDKARELMKSWYREHAKLKFAEYAEPIIPRFARYGVAPASLYVQEMENRWGSHP